MRVTCEACRGCGWVLDRGAEWGRECRVCGGRGRVSEYRIARLGAIIRGPEVESWQWTKRALRDLRRGRGLGARRGLRLVALLASLARLRP